MSNTIVSTDWLKENISDPDLIILDASQGKTASGDVSDLDGFQIEGARFFDLKNVFSDQKSKYSNMLPSPKIFEQECQKLGINQSSKIMVYDNLGIYYSPRVWWMFKTMGHENVYVLNGGLPAWNQKGNKIIPKNSSAITQGNFQSSFKDENVKDLNYVFRNLNEKDSLVIDARSNDRFHGRRIEPRLESKAGHIPNSINIHYKSVLNNGFYRPTIELRKKFQRNGINQQPLIFTCGSGITACIVLLAAEKIFDNPKSLYDGSWNEWGQADHVPIEK